jgi:4-amino-4-deoxy-L-arabinose transferase-like glycosyltransferase
MSTPTIPRPPTPQPTPQPTPLSTTGRARAGAHAAPPDRSGARTSIWRSPPGDPVWARPAALTLLAATALLYLWNLGASGWANSYYAAAVQAGTQSWKAFLFGSLDAGNVITVDKTPASLWVMELSGRLFGLSSWSMLAPQALEGVAAVGLLYLAVRRVSGPAAGLLAGAGLALTPVAALMFRFNNPDALLVLLLVAAAYGTVRAMELAVERAGTRWLVLAGVCLGFGFLTKMLQAFLVLPALAITFLLFADGPVRRRIGQLLAAGAALLISAGWWVAIVQLWPASSRPYVGGSTNNSVLELALGYNGLSRVLGNTGGGPSGSSGGGGGGQNTGFGGASGVLRMFGDAFGTEVSWLLPAALVALALGLWTTRRAPRTDPVRASLVLWGLWMLVTAAVFSFMSGTVHPYYAVALAPAIAALVAIGGHQLWRHRDEVTARIGLAGMAAVTGIWSIVLLTRTPDWSPWLRYALVPLTVLAVVALLLTTARARARLAGLTLAVALLAGFTATGAYTVQTAALPHNGSIPTSGPSSSAMGGGFGGRGATGQPPGGAGPIASGSTTSSSTTSGSSTSGSSTSSGMPGGTGGGMDGSSASSELVALLKGTTTTWSAATVGAQSAASLELSTGTAVIGIGGFTSSDPAPTLAQFQAYVKAGQVHYFIASGTGGGQGGPGGSGGSGGPGGSGTGSAIASWVAAHYQAVTVGGTTVYDLTSPTS